MKALSLLPLAALSAAFVYPDQEVMSAVVIEKTEKDGLLAPPIEIFEELEETVTEWAGCAKHRFENAVDYISETAADIGSSLEDAFDHQSWLDSTEDAIDDFVELDRPPRHPRKRPGHRKPHGPYNLTVFELIAKSKYTTKLAKLVSEFDDLVELLNGTAANYTVFAPLDSAFEKIPKDAPKPSKEFLKALLTYHVSGDFYPAGRVLVSRTIPSLLTVPELGDEAQRLSIQITLKGLAVDFYSRIRAVNIAGTNGVIHAVDSILVPPPKISTIIKLLPGEFSTLQLALYQTGLANVINDTSLHVGGTAFAPTNTAFKFLGPKINAFLFSKYGTKYLKALLEYHLVPNFTLYSDAFYKGSSDSDSSLESLPTDDSVSILAGHKIPKGRYHIDLPTALKGKSLAIDIARFGRLIEIKINGYNRVGVPDGVAKDGVIHSLNTVLIPPKKPGESSVMEGELTVEDLMERLEPFVQEDEYKVDL